MDEHRFDLIGQEGTTVHFVVHRPGGDVRCSVTEEGEPLLAPGQGPLGAQELEDLVDHAERVRVFAEPVEYTSFMVCEGGSESPTLWTRPRRTMAAAAGEIRSRVAIARPVSVLAVSEVNARAQLEFHRPIKVEE
jgi:hypothetical protein